MKTRRKLKAWIGNLDGYREALIVSTSQKAAAAILDTSLHDFRAYFSELTGPISMYEQDKMYTRLFSSKSGFVKGKCQRATR